MKSKAALIRQLKFAFSSCSTTNGFAIPIAVGLGLVMILVGITMLARSQGDNINAIQQQGTDDSLYVTEAGVTQVLAFIKNNTPIAAYNLTNWQSSATTYKGICSNNISNIVTGANALASWSNINGNSTKQFQLQNYTYQPDNPANGSHSIPGTGTLEVLGRTGVTTANPSGASRQHLKVTIRVKPPLPPTFPVPGLWVGQSASSGTNNEANILGACGVSLANMSTPTPPWQILTGVTMDFPSLPPYPAVDTTLTSAQTPPPGHIPSSQNLTSTVTGTYPRTTGTPDRANSNGIYEYIVASGVTFSSPTITSGQKVVFYIDLGSNQVSGTYPRSGDVPDYNGVYNYLVNSINSVTITAPQKVNFYLTGNGGEVNHDCIPSTIFTCSLDFKIYGYGTTSSIPQFALNGNKCVHNAFILAPTYSLDHQGGGNCGYTVLGDYIGVAWVGTWTGTGGSNHTGMRQDPSLTWANIMGAGVTLDTLPPTITPATSWQQVAY